MSTSVATSSASSTRMIRQQASRIAAAPRADPQTEDDDLNQHARRAGGNPIAARPSQPVSGPSAVAHSHAAVLNTPAATSRCRRNHHLRPRSTHSRKQQLPHCDSGENPSPLPASASCRARQRTDDWSELAVTVCMPSAYVICWRLWPLVSACAAGSGCRHCQLRSVCPLAVRSL